MVGVTAATGHLPVEQLLERGEPVWTIVRSPETPPTSVRQHANLTIIRAPILDCCDAVASCLGHTLNLKG